MQYIYNSIADVTKLVKLQNFSETSEWEGPWSNTCENWTSQLRTELDHMEQDQEEEGEVFFMTFTDFCQHFSDFQVCYYHDDYKYSALKLEKVHKSHNVFLEFQITTPGKFYFSLNQINKGFFKPEQNYKYSNLAFLISRKGCDQQIEYVGGSIKSDKENWMVHDCIPGKYTVMAKANWRSFVQSFSFSIYGPQTCAIQRVIFLLLQSYARSSIAE